MRFALIGALILLALVQLATTGRDIAHRWQEVREAGAATELKAVSRELLRLGRDSALDQQAIAFALNRPVTATAPAQPPSLPPTWEMAELDRLLHRLEQQEDAHRWSPALHRLRNSALAVQATRPAAVQALAQPLAERDPSQLEAWRAASDRHIAAFLDVLTLLHQPQRAAVPGSIPFQQMILVGLRLRAEAGAQVLSVTALAAGTEMPEPTRLTAQERAAVRVELMWTELGASITQTGDAALARAWKVARDSYSGGFEPLRQGVVAGVRDGNLPDAAMLDGLERAGAGALNAMTDLIASAVDRGEAETEAANRLALLNLLFSLKLLTVWLVAILAAALVVRLWVLQPIGRLAEAMRLLASGDAEVAVPRIRGPGEVAAMADAVRIFKANAHQLRQEVATRQRTERLLEVERQVLEMVAGTAALEEVLAAICLGIEERIDGARCSIQLLSPDTQRLGNGVGPSLPAAYLAALQDVQVGPASGSCGTALYRRQPVVVADIATDPLWADYRELALAHGLRACWSTPIMAADGTPLGAFATYYLRPRAPDPWEMDQVGRAEHLAAVVIGARRAEDKLRKAMAQAELASRTKSEFLANMSHELRTPLNAIIGFAEVLDEELRDSRAAGASAEYAGDIVAAGRHLLQLINDILDVSKMEAGKVELRERICDVGELLAGCERIVRARALERQLDVQLEVPVGLPPALVDDVKFKQIILNLLSNSIKFTGPGGTIRIAAEASAAIGLRIRVSDTGIGIRPEDMEKLFVPFHQIDSVYSRLTPGTGLGLALSRGLAELHGGTLTLESDYGVGTTAILTLPPDRLMSPEIALGR